MKLTTACAIVGIRLGIVAQTVFPPEVEPGMPSVRAILRVRTLSGTNLLIQNQIAYQRDLQLF